MQHHAARYHGPDGLQKFLQNVRRYAQRIKKQPLSQGPDTPAASSQGLRGYGAALGMGVCTTAIKPCKRKRRYGAGGPGLMKCPEIGEELFASFVDSIRNIRGRMPSFLFLDVARCISKDLLQWRTHQKENGAVAPHARMNLLVLDYWWL